MNGIAFFLKHLPPFSGNIVLGVVAGYKHKGTSVTLFAWAAFSCASMVSKVG